MIVFTVEFNSPGLPYDTITGDGWNHNQGSLEVKLPTIWTDGKAEVEQKTG